MFFHDLDRRLSIAFAWAAFLSCSLAPFLWLLIGSMDANTARAAATALAAERQQVLMSHTLLLGSGIAACALAVGVPLGAVMARCDGTRIRLARMLFVTPLMLPSYVLVLAWIVMAEPWIGAWTYSLPAAVAVLGFSFYPVVMLATEAAVRSLSSRVQESAWLVAPALSVWIRIVAPLIAPAVLASTLLVFVLSIADFAVPSMLRVRVYTTEVFTAFSALYDLQRAVLLSLPLIFVAALAAVVAIRMVQRPIVARAERGEAGAQWSRTRQRVAAALLTAVSIAVVATPVVALASEARIGRLPFATAWSGDAVRNTVIWSAAGATAVVGVGGLLGHWCARASMPSARMAEVIWVMLFAVPATVTGIGVIAVWNRPGVFGEVYRNGAIVLLAYVSRFLPIGALLCTAALRRVPPGVEEASILAGTSFRRTAVGVVFPLAARSLIAIWLIMFVLMSGDVALAILVAPPGESTLPIRAYTLMANSPAGDVARIGLVQIALSLLPLLGLMMIGDRAEWGR